MRNKNLDETTAQEFAGLQIDQLSKLRSGNITVAHLRWFNNLSFDEREKLVKENRPKSEILVRLITKNKNLTLDATDGVQSSAYANYIFPDGITNEGNVPLSWVSHATKEQEIDIYVPKRILSPCSEIIHGINSDLDKLCLTPAQIINFCIKHRSWLPSERVIDQGTYFVLKIEDEFFFAQVSYGHKGLWIDIFPVKSSQHSDIKARFVVPRQSNK